MTAGYSGTPLAQKLGVRTGQTTWRKAMPDTVAAEIAGFGEEPLLLDAPVAVPREHPYTVEALQQATLAVYSELAARRQR